MKPPSLYPGIVPDGTGYFEALDAADHARRNATAIRALALTIPQPRGHFARVEWTHRLNGMRAAAHLLDTHATAYRLHANYLKEMAK